jgi:hypothetical protein
VATLHGEVLSTLGPLQDWGNRAYATLTNPQVQRIVPMSAADAGRGQFQFVALPPGSYELGITAAGHRGFTTAVTLGADNYELPEVSDVEGAAVLEFIEDDGQQTQLLRSRVLLEGSPDHSGILVRATVQGNLVATTLTDGSGAFALQIAPADLVLSFTHAGYLPAGDVAIVWDPVQERFERLDLPLSAFDVDGLSVLSADRSAALTGLLRSPVDGFDLSSAGVTLVSDVRQPLAVGQNGRFTQEQLRPGLYGVEIVVAGHVEVSRLVQLTANETAEMEVNLEPRQISMVGYVDLQGEEIDADVVVRLRRNGALVDTTLSDPDGRFVFDALPVAHTLAFSRNGFISPPDVPVVFDDDAFVANALPLDSPQNATPMQRLAQSDEDGDGVIDRLDNCATTFNPDQDNLDGDEFGDVCDTDADNDGWVGGLDNCPTSYNPAQEDSDGDGRGFVCSGGSIDAPLSVGCGIARQVLDTRPREDLTRGSCGGAGAPEVAYNLAVQGEERLHVDIDAGHVLALYLIDENGNEAHCQTSGRLTLTADDAVNGEVQVPAGNYLLVVDGLVGQGSAGPIRVNMTHTGCRYDAEPIINQFEPLGTPSRIRVADLDGDGNEDLVVLSASVTVHLSSGLGHLPRTLIVAQRDPDNPTVFYSVAVGDFDADQDLDVAWVEDDQLHWRLLDGGRVVTGSGSVTVTDRAQLEAGDINGDGRADLAVIDTLASTVTPYLSSGNNFAAGSASAIVQGAYDSSAVADLSGNGRSDLAVVAYDGTGVQLFYGQANGTFSTAAPTVFAERLAGVVALDYDGDGDTDLVAGQRELFDQFPLPGGLWFRGNDGNGNFTGHRYLSTEGNGVPRSAGDVHGTGQDALLARMGSLNRLVIWDADLNRLRYDVRFNITDPVTETIDADGDGLRDVIGGTSIYTNNGDGTFTGYRGLPTDAQSDDITLSDLDRDGRLDVVVHNLYDLGVYRNLGDRQFGPETRVRMGARPYDTIAVDLDGDDIPDLASTTSDGTVVVRFGVGDGTLGDEVATPLPGAAFDMTAEDVDRDGDMDILVTRGTADELLLLSNDGDGGLTLTQTLAVTDNPRAVQAADVNADGWPDVAVLNASTRDVVVFLNQEGTLVEGPRTSVPSGTFLTSHDVDGDGYADLLAGGGALIFGAARGIGFVDRTAPTGRLADLDADGHVDVVRGGCFARGRGDGTFEAEACLGNARYEARVGDLDGDGNPDVVAASRDDARVFWGSPTAALVPARSRVSLGVSIFFYELADFNGDGLLDVVATDRGRASLVVRLGLGRGEFGPEMLTAATPSSLRIQTGDLNGDNVPDVLVENYADSDLGLFFGLGDGTFEPMVRFGAGITQPVLAHLNGDDDLDLVVRTGGSVRLYFGDGEGSFTVHETHSVLPNVFGVDVADLNNDGLVDIFVHDEGVNSLWKVLLGQPGPTWDNGVPRVDPGFQFYDSELADVDGDGFTDLLTHDSVAGVAVWLPGLGDGTFAGRVSITREGTINSFGTGYHAVDIEGDGDTDLVFGSHNEVVVVTNAGGGHFAEPARIHLSGSPNASLQVADVDLDGRLDVAWVLHNGNEMGIAFGKLAATEGTKFERSRLPTCAPTTLVAEDITAVASFALLPDVPCRVDRLGLEPSAALAQVSLRTPAGEVAFAPPGSVRWSGSNVRALARFQATSAYGTWRVGVSEPMDGLDLTINRFPADPFALPAPACTAQADPSEDPESICLLEDTLGGLVTTDADEDVFLLRGQLDGAYAVGDDVAIHVQADRPVDLEIRTVGASGALVAASGVTDEQMSFVVPPAYHGRYFSVHVRGSDGQPSTYTLTP